MHKDREPSLGDNCTFTADPFAELLFAAPNPCEGEKLSMSWSEKQRGMHLSQGGAQGPRWHSSHGRQHPWLVPGCSHRGWDRTPT